MSRDTLIEQRKESRDTKIGDKRNEPLPTNIRILMDNSGTRPVDLAKILGVSSTAIGRYRDGIDKPTLEKLVKIADYYRVTTDSLLGRTGCFFFDSPDLEEIGFSERAALTLKSLATERAMERDPDGFFHKIFDELSNFIASPQFYIFFSLLYRARGAAVDSRSRLERMLQDNGTPEEVETEFQRFESTIATEEVKNGYMYARYQIDRQVREMLDDYLGDKEVCTMFKRLEQKMLHQKKEQKAQKKAIKNKRKEDQDGNDQED